MLKFSNIALATVALSSALVSTKAFANSCQGELFAMNSGRGELGVMFSLDEQNKAAKAESLAKYSSSAIAYDPSTNRTYYASSPMPLEYKVDVSGLDLSEEMYQQLPVRADKFRYNRLAYLDHATGEHVEVGITESVIGMAYDSASDKLLAVSYTTLYSIDKNTGEAEALADFSKADGLTRGDLVIQNGELYLITSTSVYSIDRTTYKRTKLSKHNLVAVGGATVGQNGDLLISRTVINDHGHKNESLLYKLNPYTGGTCLVATLPVRINDLTTNTANSVACYTQDPCGLDNTIPYYSEAVIKQLDHNWKTYDFGSQSFYEPMVFTSAPTFNGGHGGANRVKDITPYGFTVSFQEWQYLKNKRKHPNIESFDFLALEAGRYTMTDGTVVEVGSFTLDDTRVFDQVNFGDSFNAKPHVFLQTQTFNGHHTITTRVKDITETGFKAAFFEQDAYDNGHYPEQVAYFAILPGSGSTGTLETQVGNKAYSLHSDEIDHTGGKIGKHYYILAEDQSVDREVKHAKETVQVIDIEQVSLAQHTSNNGPDNFSIRRK